MAKALTLPRDLVLQNLKMKAPDIYKKVTDDRKVYSDFFKLVDYYDLDQIIRMMRGR
jgi:hypothetical protein